jgi:hypothetical protein
MTLAWGVLGLFSIVGGMLFALAVGREERIRDFSKAFSVSSHRAVSTRQ